MNMDQLLQQKPGLMTADMNGETVMMDAESGNYFSLGTVAGAIWNMLSTPMTANDLIQRLTQEYDVSAEQCKADTVPFLENLLEKGLLQEK